MEGRDGSGGKKEEEILIGGRSMDFGEGRTGLAKCQRRRYGERREKNHAEEVGKGQELLC